MEGAGRLTKSLTPPKHCFVTSMSHDEVDHRALRCKSEGVFSLISELHFSPLAAPILLVFLSLQVQGNELKEALGVMEQGNR